MSEKFTLHYRVDDSPSAQSIDVDGADVVSCLLDMSRSRPDGYYPGVNIVNSRGDLFSVGMCDDKWSVCCAIMQNGEPVAQYALVSQDATGGLVEIVFEEHYELPRSELVPRALAISAIQTWISTGNPDMAMNWTDRC